MHSCSSTEVFGYRGQVPTKPPVGRLGLPRTHVDRAHSYANNRVRDGALLDSYRLQGRRILRAFDGRFVRGLVLPGQRVQTVFNVRVPYRLCDSDLSCR